MSVLTHETHEITGITELEDVAEKIESVVCDTAELDPVAVKIVAGVNEIPQEKVDLRFVQITENLIRLGFDIRAKQGTLEDSLRESEDARALLELYEKTGTTLITQKPEILWDQAEKIAKAIEIAGEPLAEAVTEVDTTELPDTIASIALIEAAQDFCEDPEQNKNVCKHYKELYKQKQNEQNQLALERSKSLPKLNPLYKKVQIHGPGTVDIQSNEYYNVKPHNKLDSSYGKDDVTTLELLLSQQKKSEHEARILKLAKKAMKFLQSRI